MPREFATNGVSSSETARDSGGPSDWSEAALLVSLLTPTVGYGTVSAIQGTCRSR